ncbi:Uncharacterised protein [Peptoniphilus harei]|uniref:hypothetical protein n=1 Tax=Peptoniphilus harei TaxID=54005 RepID=UPI000F6B6DD7|nr:hypothetical protein [Peptoniphilus harei]MDU6743366.1 hypothetical protein [Peptoniphilus harei]QQE46661.1 hypothetical protein I6H69_07185 [Peptoniphilus harei]VEJ35398.1 Uncharacterised protein [Peptoniphilus harei]
MDALKCLAFIIFAIFWARQVPENYKIYKEDKSWENFLILLGKILMVIASIILAIGVYV